MFTSTLLCFHFPSEIPKSMLPLYGHNSSTSSSPPRTWSMHTPTGNITPLTWTKMFLSKSFFHRFCWYWVTGGRAESHAVKFMHLAPPSNMFGCLMVSKVDEYGSLFCTWSSNTFFKLLYCTAAYNYIQYCTIINHILAVTANISTKTATVCNLHWQRW